MSGWRFSQVFTNSETPSQAKFATRQVTEGDILSAVEFDPSGEFLATGDKGGQVCVFQRTSPSKSDSLDDEEDEVVGKKRATKSFASSKEGGGGAGAAGGSGGGGGGGGGASSSGASASAASLKFNGFVEFQSHNPGFDYLKSLEIEEKINQIKWCNRSCNSLLLLSTNDKTIKLWKLSMKNQLTCVGTLTQPKLRKPITSSRDLSIPRVIRGEERRVIYKEARTYADAHTYHINSVSVSSDGINFISADDLRVYLWDINRGHKCVGAQELESESRG
jgi:serine/threonine-protein phosphatase 2A regulatory subunit B